MPNGRIRARMNGLIEDWIVLFPTIMISVFPIVRSRPVISEFRG
jgi:hypothetical protein